jgi:precorrin-4/cobalt-precorrin-4 C11-methyltransferase
MTRVYFIGAGPGDPELLTVKGEKIIERADVIIYADSLIDEKICSGAKKGAEVYKSASLTLEEISKIMVRAVKEEKTVARLQSGDPSIYGAIAEQMEILDEAGIEYEIIPGVSALGASAAALKTELTIPGLSQTVIITRMEGRTPVPQEESLSNLARHKATLAIFLSIGRIEKIVEELLKGGYSPDTPAAVVYRASFEDEEVIRATLKDIALKVKERGIERRAIVVIGDVLKAKGYRSRLYDKGFGHGYRK